MNLRQNSKSGFGTLSGANPVAPKRQARWVGLGGFRDTLEQGVAKFLRPPPPQLFLSDLRSKRF